MDWRKEMFQWYLGTEPAESPSPEPSRNELDWETEKEFYSKLEFMTLAALVQPEQQESSKHGANVNKLIHLRTVKCEENSMGCCLNVGHVVLIVVLLTASISLLSLYLHASYQLHAMNQEAEELRINQSRCQEELGDQQEMNMNQQSNITFLIQDNKSRQELTLSQLQQMREQIVQDTQSMEHNYQQLYTNHSRLQEMYTHLRSSHVFLHRDSAILHNCHRTNLTDDGAVCPFCRSDWQLFGVSCYMVAPSATNWKESARWCRIQGGHLVVVNNLEEQYFLQDLTKTTVWIGLSDRDFEGDWHWVDGTPYVTSGKFCSLWMPNQPDNFDNEDCVTISPGSGWNDEKCVKSYHSLCEHRAFQLILQGDTIHN